MNPHRWMLYGASGYTGRLLAEEAVRRGHRPLLAGRSSKKLAALGSRLELEWQAVDLNDSEKLTATVSQVELVLHAAGPFVQTAHPMLAACLHSGAHYIDITGELPVFQQIYALDEQARRRGIALLPGAGFDVVPSDCLAAYNAARLPSADRLSIAIAASGGISAGTLKSGLEVIASGGLVRREGVLTRLPLGQGLRRLRFIDQERSILPAPLADLESAFRSTAIPNITTYYALPARTARRLKTWGGLFQRLMNVSLLRGLLQRLIQSYINGPTLQQRRRGSAVIWSSASDPHGQQVEAWLKTPEPYTFTAVAALRCLENLLEQPQAGAFSPAQAFGPDFVLDIEGISREDQ